MSMEDEAARRHAQPQASLMQPLVSPSDPAPRKPTL
jgi:hypothetical protein